MQKAESRKPRDFFSAYCLLPTTHFRASRGVSLIDTLVGTALMLVIFLGIAGAIQLSLDVVTNNKARAGAIALANERMEYIRSLAYASVGTVGGIPSGTLAQTETTTMNGITCRVAPIEYVDDAKDGSAGLTPTASLLITKRRK
jgi:Tfp pilus assembly protein PilV